MINTYNNDNISENSAESKLLLWCTFFGILNDFGLESLIDWADDVAMMPRL